VDPTEDRQTRYHAIDNLRATMISIVMFGHALLPYVTFPRSFKDPQTHIGFDAIAIFLYGFAMPVFFVTAGFSTALIHQRKGLRGLGRNRVQRIFLPLLAAYVLLSPLTRAAFRFTRETAQSGSLQAGLDRVLLGDWIYWGKPYHLWFLVSLLVYSALAVGLRWSVLRIAGDRKDRLLSAFRYLFVSRGRLPLLTLLVASMMVPAYVVYGADATTVPMQLALFGFFVFGWLLYLHRDLLPTFQRRAWRPIAAAILVLPLAVWSTRARLVTPDDGRLLVGMVAGITNSLLAACMTFGLLGVFGARSSRPSALGQYVSDASYWVYLIHYPLVIAAAGLLIVTPFPALLKYLLTLAIVVPVVLASYHFGVRSTRFGRWLKSDKRAAKV
jgi:peptidoglycan/LPS O-acetylase OafA/YrhL